MEDEPKLELFGGHADAAPAAADAIDAAGAAAPTVGVADAASTGATAAFLLPFPPAADEPLQASGGGSGGGNEEADDADAAFYARRLARDAHPHYQLPALPDELDREADAISAAATSAAAAASVGVGAGAAVVDDDDEFGDVLKEAAAAAAVAVAQAEARAAAFDDDEFLHADSKSAGGGGGGVVAANGFLSHAVLDLDGDFGSTSVAAAPAAVAAAPPLLPQGAPGAAGVGTWSEAGPVAALRALQAALARADSDAAAAAVTPAPPADGDTGRDGGSSSSCSSNGGVGGGAAVLSAAVKGPLASVAEGEEDEAEEEEAEDDDEDGASKGQGQGIVSAGADPAGFSGPASPPLLAPALPELLPSIPTPPGPRPSLLLKGGDLPPAAAVSESSADVEAQFERATAEHAAEAAAAAALPPPSAAALTAAAAAQAAATSLSFTAAARHLFAAERTAPFLGAIVPTYPEASCLARLFAPQLRAASLAERDAVFCVAKAPYAQADATHTALMRTLYSRLTGRDAGREGVASWQAIGFQRDADFSTDLRGGGMLGPLQALYLVDRRPWLARSMFAAAQDPVTGFPFMVQSIGLTARALHALRVGALNSLCNARARAVGGGDGASAGEGPVLAVFNDYFAGLALSFTQEWRKSGATVSRMGHVMQEVAAARPEKLVAALASAQAEADAKPATRAGGEPVKLAVFSSI